MVVHFLDRIFAHALDRVALGILFAGFFQHGVEEAQVGGTGFWIQPAGKIKHHIIGNEVIAVGPFDALCADGRSRS